MYSISRFITLCLILMLQKCGVLHAQMNMQDSSLIQPQTVVNDPFPFECSTKQNRLEVLLLAPTSYAKRVEFEWIVPSNETIDPRTYTEIDEFNSKKVISVPVYGDTVQSGTIPFHGAPRNTRMIVRVLSQQDSGFWEVTSKGCWTGKTVKEPTAVAQILTISLQKILAHVTLPNVPNGPIDGLMIRWCPRTNKNCPPEDFPFADQKINVEYSFATLLEPMEDSEKETHELCIAAYNLNNDERLLGHMKCIMVGSAF